MLGRDQAFTMVPFFWTKHFDLSIRYVGHAPKWDETQVEGDLAQRDCLVRFRRAGRDLAVATVERDKKSLRAEWRWKVFSGPLEQLGTMSALLKLPKGRLLPRSILTLFLIKRPPPKIECIFEK